MTKKQASVSTLLPFDAARYLHDDSAIAPRYGVQHLSPALAKGFSSSPADRCNVDRMFTLPVLIGIALAPAIVALGRLSGLDRDRALYPVALIVIAAYYVLFAAMGGAQALASELIAATVFVVVAIVGFRTSLWWVAAGIAGHGVFDWFVHPHLIANPGMPVFWPAFCGSIDVALGVLIAVLLLRGAIPARG